MPTSPRRTHHARDRADTRVLQGALGISVIVHAAVFLLPLSFGGARDVESERTTVSPAAEASIELLRLSVASELRLTVSSILPVIPGEPDGPRFGPVTRRTAPELGADPVISAAEFFRRVGPSPLGPTRPTVSASPWPIERRSVVRTLARVLDSIAEAEAVEQDIRTWSGGDFSASPGQMSFFGLKLPYCGGGANSSDCGFGVSPWRRAESQNRRVRLGEIRSSAHLVDIRERAARMRARRDAQRDTTGGG